MKYCPNCGAELPDEARFCTHCGSKQPEAPAIEPKEEAPAPQVVEEPIAKPAPQVVDNKKPTNQQMSPRQRYNYLVKNDEVFREIVVVRRKKYLFELIFLVVIVSWLVSMFVPVALFNGNNATAMGISTMSSLGKPLPHKTSAFDLIAIDAAAGKYALTPGGLSASFAIMFNIFGPIFCLLITALPFIKAFTGRGYVLKTYEEGKAKDLIKETVRPGWAMGILNIFMMAPALNLFFSAQGAEYEDGGDPYIFGEIEGLPSGFIVVVIIVLLMTAISIAFSVVIDNIISKKLKEFAKNM